MTVTSLSDAPVKKRKTQERAEVTKQKLLDSACSHFADRGFDAVTVRDIEVDAGVQRGLLAYHFGGKENIWHAVIDQIVEEYKVFRRVRVEAAQDLSAHECLRFRIRAFVRFSAQRPELNQLMMQEGKRESWRLKYVIESFLKDTTPETRALAQSDLSLTDEAFVHWYYLYLGAGALVFSLAPEAKELFGVDVTEETFITRHANMLADILTGGFATANMEAAE